MKLLKLVFTCMVPLSICLTSFVYGGTVDFESIPGGTPTEGLEISTQYLEAEGISFSLEGGGFPRIAKVGSPATAFASELGDDTPLPNQNVGTFFLTDDGNFTERYPSVLIITYNTPTSAASGVILDVDSTALIIARSKTEYSGRRSAMLKEWQERRVGVP